MVDSSSPRRARKTRRKKYISVFSVLSVCSVVNNMTRVLAIADDLSGAAEIAGIGLRYGLPRGCCASGRSSAEQG